MTRDTLKSIRRAAWVLSLGLLVLSSCKTEVDEKVAEELLDDPWVDAIEAEAEEAVPGTEGPPQAGAALGAAEVGEAAAVGEPAEAEGEGEPAAVGDEPAGAGDGGPSSDDARSEPKVATAEHGGPTPAEDRAAAEEPTVAEDPEPEPPAPVAEPTPAPKVEPAKPASPPPITIADFHGSYRYSGGSSQRADLADAIEATVVQLPRAIQGIARRRLTATSPVDPSVDIVVAGDKITTTLELSLDVTCVVDGPTANTRDIEGGKLVARVRSKGSKVVQLLQGKGGARTIVYVLSADRTKLTVHHKITADRLPSPIAYRLTYTRK